MDLLLVIAAVIIVKEPEGGLHTGAHGGEWHGLPITRQFTQTSTRVTLVRGYAVYPAALGFARNAWRIHSRPHARRLRQKAMRSGGRPSLSGGELLGKILRRNSHLPVTDDDSQDQHPERLDADDGKMTGQRDNNLLPPPHSNSRFTTYFIDPLCHAISLAKSRSERESLSYVLPPRPGVEVWTADEAKRREAICAQSFGDLHHAFRPVGMCADAMDNNELEAMLQQEEDKRQADEGRSSLSAAQEARSEDDEELDFDGDNMHASVRQLIRRIESESLDSDPHEFSATSNQDDDEDDAEQELSRSSRGRKFMYPSTVSDHPDHSVLFYPESASQDLLTRSVRRLVIGLKDDADRHNSQSNSQPPRRRGNSCPSPYYPPSSSETSSSAADLSAPPRSTGHSRWKGRGALSRLAPRLFDTLTFRRKRKSYLYTDEELESVEGARWKIVELALRFGGKHRFYLVQAVNMFFPLVKYGRHGGPHETRLYCNRCGTLQWQHKRGGLSDPVDLADVMQIAEGRSTSVFRKYSSSIPLESRSLSIVFRDRTLDLETQSSSHRDWLMSALRTLVSYARKQRDAEKRAIAERSDQSVEETDVTPPLSVHGRPAPSHGSRT